MEPPDAAKRLIQYLDNLAESGGGIELLKTNEEIKIEEQIIGKAK